MQMYKKKLTSIQKKRKSAFVAHFFASYRIIELSNETGSIKGQNNDPIW